MRIIIYCQPLVSWVYILIRLKLCLIWLIVTKRRHPFSLLTSSSFHWILAIFMRHRCSWILRFHIINTSTLRYLWEMCISALSAWNSTLNLGGWFPPNQYSLVVTRHLLSEIAANIDFLLNLPLWLLLHLLWLADILLMSLSC